MKKKLFLKGVAASLTVALSVSGLTAFAQTDNCNSDGYCISANGDISPYTLYISEVRTQVYPISGSAIQYTLTMRTIGNVSHGYMHATVQRYEYGTWVDAAPTRYYEAWNTNYFNFVDTVYDLPQGEYRVVVDYNVSHNGYADYVYDESQNHVHL